jgi:hypothetical protein
VGQQTRATSISGIVIEKNLPLSARFESIFSDAELFVAFSRIIKISQERNGKVRKCPKMVPYKKYIM